MIGWSGTLLAPGKHNFVPVVNVIVQSVLCFCSELLLKQILIFLCGQHDPGILSTISPVLLNLVYLPENQDFKSYMSSSTLNHHNNIQMSSFLDHAVI